MEWKNFFRGLLMGATDLIPGVSGGTVAVILGIYDRLIVAISKFFSREWKKQLLFLLPLAIGMATAIFSLSHLIKWLLKYYPQPTYFFFIGLILGIVPFLLRKVNYKKTFQMRHYIVTVLAGIMLALTAFITEKDAAIIEKLTLANGIDLFFSGWLASTAMLLPGISGSFVLVLLGKYETVLTAIAHINLPVIFVVAFGIVVGFILTSKFIHYILRVIPITTYALIVGMLLGSIVVIFPGVEKNLFLLFLSLATFVIGFFLAYTIGKYEH